MDTEICERRERQAIHLRVEIEKRREQLLYINVQLFRGGLVFQAHRRLYHSTLGLTVMMKKIEERTLEPFRSVTPIFMARVSKLTSVG